MPEVASEKELSDFLMKNLSDTLKQAIKSSVSIMVKTEMQQIKEELKEGSLQFNGYYDRNLVSPVGKIEDVQIPRFRSGNTNHDLQSMKVFEEEKERFLGIVSNLHLVGVSQRKVDDFCKLCFGKAVAPKITKTVFEELFENEAFQVNKKLLQEAPQEYLFLDGVWVEVKSEKTGISRKRVVLVALGMDENGKKQILGFKLAYEEDEKEWKEFIESLEKRGLALTRAKLAIVDGNAGCISALERLRSDLPLQVCISHRYRNVLKYTGHQHKKEMGADLRNLTTSESADEFIEKTKAMEKKWQTIAPRAMKSLTFNLKLSTTYFSFEKQLWSKIRTTNAIDRTFREVRSRTQVNYNYYNSPQSAEKYHNAIFSNLNRNYF